MLAVTSSAREKKSVAARRSQGDDRGESVPADEPRVNFGARIRASVRKRARLYAVEHDIDLQDVIDQAIDEYLRKRGV